MLHGNFERDIYMHLKYSFPSDIYLFIIINSNSNLYLNIAPIRDSGFVLVTTICAIEYNISVNKLIVDSKQCHAD